MITESQHATLEVSQMSGSLFECEWAGVEVVIGPNRFGLGCCWVQIQFAGSNLHTDWALWNYVS